MLLRRLRLPCRRPASPLAVGYALLPGMSGRCRGRPLRADERTFMSSLHSRVGKAEAPARRRAVAPSALPACSGRHWSECGQPPAGWSRRCLARDGEEPGAGALEVAAAEVAAA